MLINETEKRLLEELKNKFNSHPDELAAALEGLLYNKGVFYWDYINLLQLHNLQQPKTNFPDEVIFIVYHQICELYFLLILHELRILTSIENKEFLNENNWIKRIGRCINYYQKLTDSIDIMQPGQQGEANQFFSTEEFVRFRQALSPASGFQSVSLRQIEIYSTGIINLCHKENQNNNIDLLSLYNKLYWKSGSLMLSKTGEKLKTKTLNTFEEKYDSILYDLANKMQYRNLEYLFCNYKPDNNEEKKSLEKVRSNKKIKELLKTYDNYVNKEWKQKHLLVIRQHLNDDNIGTGGTNWKDYLPPKLQNICFFPNL